MDLMTVVPWLCTVASAIIGLLGWTRSTKGDTATQATWMGNVNAKLDNIMSELARLGDVRERVAVAETSLKSLHKRVDALEEKMAKEG